MNQPKSEMFGWPLVWAAGLGAAISTGFGVPFLDVAGLIYFGVLFASGIAWRCGRDACLEEQRKQREAAAKLWEDVRQTPQIRDLLKVKEVRHGKV